MGYLFRNGCRLEYIGVKFAEPGSTGLESNASEGNRGALKVPYALKIGLDIASLYKKRTCALNIKNLPLSRHNDDVQGGAAEECGLTTKETRWALFAF